MRHLGLAALLIVTSITPACGGGGGDGPDAAYADQCGPVKTDGADPNTLLNSIDHDATLKKACSPYYVDKPTTVTATLTIEPGVEIIACQGGCRSRITVGHTGKLIANGTAEEPILFTSKYAAGGGPLGGQWTGILFLESLPDSSLQHVIIEYAGGPYTGTPGDNEFNRYEFPVEGSLLNDSTPDLLVSDVWIRHSRGYAAASTTSAEFETSRAGIYSVFERITMTDNEKSLWIPVDQGGTLGADLCWFERNPDGTCPAGPAPAGQVVELHVDDRLMRTPEDVHRDATWKPYAAPYVVDNINIVDNATLTINDGVELRMTNYGGIYVGFSAPGSLDMRAATPGGIKITSAYQAPTLDQYWKGLYIWENADPSKTHVENVDLSYGGRKAPNFQVAPSIIGIYKNDPTIEGNHVSNSRGEGIHWDCLAHPYGLPDTFGGPTTNTSDDATIACSAAIGAGIAQNYGCPCPMTGCETRCPNNP